MFVQRVPGNWRAAFCALFSFILASHATTVIAPRFETLVDRAELIFTGQVVGQRSEWRNIDGQKSIVTLVSFAVQRIHKGHAGSVITLQFLGGKVGDVRLEVADIPRFKTGERAVLFIEGNGTAISPVIGFYHGRFPLKADASGKDMVLSHDGEMVSDVVEIGRAKRSTPVTGSRPGLSHDEFAARIRERLATAERK